MMTPTEEAAAAELRALLPKLEEAKLYGLSHGGGGLSSSSYGHGFDAARTVVLDALTALSGPVLDPLPMRRAGGGARAAMHEPDGWHTWRFSPRKGYEQREEAYA